MNYFRYVFLVAPCISSCLSTRVAPVKSDAALTLHVEQRLVLSSLNSAQQTTISETTQNGDTLFITYRRGIFLKTNANTILLPDAIRYVKCAGQLFSVKRLAGGVVLERQ